MALAFFYGGVFATPLPVNMNQWNVVSPGLDETITNPLLGRGVHLTDGKLIIRQHAFHRADLITPKTTQNVGRIEFTLAPSSGIARLVLRNDQTSVIVRFAPGYYSIATQPGKWYSVDNQGPWVVEISNSIASLSTSQGTVNIGQISGANVELTAEQEEAHFASIYMATENGQTIVAEDYTEIRPPIWITVAGGLWGAGMLLALAVILRSRPPSPLNVMYACILVILPSLVWYVPTGNWVTWGERLYLARTPGWDLARIALLLTSIPVWTLGILRSGCIRCAPTPDRPEKNTWILWAGILVFVIPLASRNLDWNEAYWAIIGGAVLAMPMLMAKKTREHASSFSVTGWMLLDVPSLLLVATLGWHLGAIPALLWRLVVILGNVKSLLEHTPRVAADQLFLLAALLIASTEFAVRGTYLDRSWNADLLSAELTPDTGWRSPHPFWADSCGSSEAPSTLSLIFAGGSSTGGAYQFRNEPDAFFPARTHHLLCQSLPSSTRLQSSNFGDGGRDSFTISRTGKLILERGGAPSTSSLLVLYLGVNDLLSLNSPFTRKERAEMALSRSTAQKGIMGLAAHSRIITGFGLMIRPLHLVGGREVPDVPLPDAEENLRDIVDQARELDTQVLMLTEVVASDMRRHVSAYTTLEARLAQELDGVYHYDVTAAVDAVGPSMTSDLLVDRNHLSRKGSENVASLLAPVVGQILSNGLVESP